MSGDYCHCHGHSDYSIADGLSTPDKAAKRLHEIGQSVISLTDHGSMAGIAIWNKQLKKQKIRLIAGNEMYVAHKTVENVEDRDTSHITLLAADKEGYHNLIKLHTLSWQRPAYYFNPRTDLNLLYKYNRGIIALSGCRGGVALKPYHDGRKDLALNNVIDLKQIFDNRFYIELQHHNLDDDEVSLEWLRKMAKTLSLPMVATADYHYVYKSDWKAHDRIIACGTGSKVGDLNRAKVYQPEQFYIKSYDEMAERFEPAVLAESVKIAERCEPLDLESKVFHLPVVDKRGLVSLSDLVYRGIEKRYGSYDESMYMRQVGDRVEYELKAIDKGGFTQYLLLLHDMYQFMDRKGIPYGLGRGSAAASIVCYALGITGVDPLAYDLLFERFINFERVSAADIDCDISSARRDEVIAYLKERWGEDKVVQIVTFGTMGARAAIRDMGRVLNKPLALCDQLAKLVPKNGSLTTDRETRHYIGAALKNVKEFKTLYATNDDAAEIIAAAIEVEGIIRQASLHAAGIVISDKPVSDYAPLLTAKADKGVERPLAVAYDMNQIESIGLIKFDLLGLTCLDTIDAVVKQLKAKHKLSLDFEIGSLPLDDKKTYSMLSKGLTQGVFQYESSSMAGWLRKLKPDCIDDLVAMVALFRPGTLDFIPDYIARKHGEKKVVYPHPDLEVVLKDTYAVPIYQEQNMKIGQIIAGWSLSRADQLRKVIGKKEVQKIAGEREQFANDASNNGYTWEFADDLFANFIEPSARYQFNKSHAVVYALLAYRTAYLKANYPLEYYAALLESVDGDKLKICAYISDAKAFGVQILAPHLNSSSRGFTALNSPIPEASKQVTFGLSSIKNVGSRAVDLIISEREKNGPYVDLFDLVKRTRNRLITTATLESLILAGALDELPGTRLENYCSVDIACERTDKLFQDAERVKEGKEVVKRRTPIPPAVLLPATIESKQINLLAKERELLGCYLTSHPFDTYATELSLYGITVTELKEKPLSGTFYLVGIVSSVKEILTKRKQKMATFTMEDSRLSIEAIAFPQAYQRYHEIIKLDEPIVVVGKFEERDEEEEPCKVVLEKAYTILSAPVRKINKPNHYILTEANYETVIKRAVAPATFVLPNGQRLYAR